MLEEEDALPGPELQLVISERDTFARACQRHANMGGAVVRALIIVLVSAALRNQPLEKPLQVANGGWRSVFHDDETATGVLDENIHHTLVKPALRHRSLNMVSDFVSALS